MWEKIKQVFVKSIIEELRLKAPTDALPFFCLVYLYST